MQNLKTLASTGAEKSVAENFVGEKEEIKGWISIVWLVLCYTVKLVIPHLCTKFHNPMSSSCCEIFDERCPYALHRSERWKKRQFEKDSKRNISILIFFYTIYLATLKVHTKS